MLKTTRGAAKCDLARQPKSRSKCTAAEQVPAAPPLQQPPADGISGANKLQTIRTLLERQGGATLKDLMDATGWQAHSVRGAIAGALKSKLKLKVTSERVEGARTYAIVADVG